MKYKIVHLIIPEEMFAEKENDRKYKIAPPGQEIDLLIYEKENIDEDENKTVIDLLNKYMEEEYNGVIRYFYR